MHTPPTHLSDGVSLPPDSAIDDMPVESAHPPDDRDRDRDEAAVGGAGSHDAAGVLFPHIDRLACTERFLVIADKEAGLHVYRTADAALVHVVAWDIAVAVASAAAAAAAAHGKGEGDRAGPGRVVHMLLGSRHCNTPASLRMTRRARVGHCALLVVGGLNHSAVMIFLHMCRPPGVSR